MKYYSKKRPTYSEKEFFYGMQPVIEALQAGKQIDKILLLRTTDKESARQVKQLAEQQEVPVQTVPKEKLDRVTAKNHQGVIALASPIPFAKLDNVLQSCFEAGKDPFVLLLDRITDVRNFGAIARTAECAGVQAIVIPQKGGARLGSDAIKTSAGALHHLPVCREPDLTKTLKYLQESGLKVVVCTEKAEDSLYTTDLAGPIACIMGAEEDGVSEELMRKADVLAKLPMQGQIQSLNVAVATGAVLFEVVRQRGKE